MRTSSSSANAGASLKACVYAADGTGGAPGTLLGSTASGTSVTDSSVSTNISLTLDSPAVVPPGIFYIAFLQTSSTGIRPTTVAGSIPASQFMGGTSVAIMGGSNVIYGYTNSQSYASGCASPFGSATAQTAIGLAEATTFQVN